MEKAETVTKKLAFSTRVFFYFLTEGYTGSTLEGGWEDVGKCGHGKPWTVLREPRMLTGSESGKYGAESGNNLIIICMQTHHMIGGSARCAGCRATRHEAVPALALRAATPAL